MIGWLKRKVLEIGARRAGKELSMGSVGKFLVDHKKTISGIFASVASWVWWQDCGVVYGIDVLALMQKVLPSLICLNVATFLKVAAAFLFGLGVSDPQEWITNFMGLAKKPTPAPVPAPGTP